MKSFEFTASRARDGYGSVRERDLNDGGKMPEREPNANTSMGRRINGKAGVQQQQQQQQAPQIQQQQQQQQLTKNRQQSQTQRPASKPMDYTGKSISISDMKQFRLSKIKKD